MSEARKLFGCLLALTLLVPQMFAQSEAAKVSVRLTHLYETYNSSYFEGRLPKNLVVYVGPARGSMAFTYNSATPEKSFIEINPAYNNTERTESLTLLHESCHVEVGPRELTEHGPLWQSCMRRLAGMGAFDNIW